MCLLSYDVCYFTREPAYEVRLSEWSSDVCSSDLASCFDAHHLVDERAGKRLYHLVDGLAEAARILQQGGDVAENDTRRRISRDGPDLVLDPRHGCQIGRAHV